MTKIYNILITIQSINTDTLAILTYGILNILN